jgi:hypothetical protein
MGYTVYAKCPCGYQSTGLSVGASRDTFRHLCAFPAYCTTGEHLITVNLFSDPLHCVDGHEGSILPYDNAALSGGAGQNMVAGWMFKDQERVLTDGPYLCPKCQDVTMQFENGGTWD